MMFTVAFTTLIGLAAAVPAQQMPAPDVNGVDGKTPTTGPARRNTPGTTPPKPPPGFGPGTLIPATQACNIGYASINGGTTGGAGGKTVYVTSLAEFVAAIAKPGPAIILISGVLTGSMTVRVSSDTTILGAPGAQLNGTGLFIQNVKNVIVRNLVISNVLAATLGDAIHIQSSTHVWIDHCELSSDLEHGKLYYDGLLDITHGSDWITASNNYFHDHFKVSLVGHSDLNSAQDAGKLHVTFANIALGGGMVNALMGTLTPSQVPYKYTSWL